MPTLNELILKIPIIALFSRRLKNLAIFIKNTREAPRKIEQTHTQLEALIGELRELSAQLNNKASIHDLTQIIAQINSKASSHDFTQLAVQLNNKASIHDINKLRRQLLTLQKTLDIERENIKTEHLAESHEIQLREGFYLAFENRFRGDYFAIQARQAVYLPVIQTTNAGTASCPILDIGSGRGEWLQLLQNNQLEAYGVDSDASMVAACRTLKLNVHFDDAFEHLSSLSEGSLGAITGFHIAEHLPFPILVALFEKALHALQPGGLLILETPNPENLLVGACYFYTDPTHLRPLPPDLLAFVAEYTGFMQVEIMRLHPFPQYDESLAHSDRPERFIFGPQDYALIARKPPLTQHS